MKNVYWIFILVTLLLGSVAPALQAEPIVHIITINSSINPATADFIINAVENANETEAAALVIQLDTPGGLVSSTRMITKAILASEVPVAVYVAPSGSRAGSAGVFITLSAHVAAMAPGTNIGAAHPIGIGGQEPDSTQSVHGEKILNDTVAYVRTLAERHGRNVEWAEDAVRNSVSITETEALELNVVDFVCRNIDSLLVEMDSLEVETVLGPHVIETTDAEWEVVEMSWRDKLLDVITDPNISYILLMIGFYGIFFEIYNPGSIVPGVIGVICLILGFYALQTLPVNYAGLALIFFGIIMLVAEIKIPSHGILSIGGVVALLFGSIMLIDSPDVAMRISWSVIIPVVGVTAAFFMVAVGAGVRAQMVKPTTGDHALIGKTGVVKVAVDPMGQILVRGEIWRAKSDTPIPVGQKVRVVAVKGLTLTVEPLEPVEEAAE